MIVLSPHLDDAALSCYAALRPQGGDPPVVINVFTDAPDGCQSLWDRVCGYADSGAVARARKAEDESALASIGIRPLNLGYRDASVRAAIRETPPTVEWIAREIDEAISSPPQTLCAPLGGGPRPNPDHVLVRDAARALARHYDSWRLILYADQPYVYKNWAWPDWIASSPRPTPSARTTASDDAIGEGTARATVLSPTSEASWWSRFPRAVPEMVSLIEGLDVVRLSEEERAAKLALMQMYETQFENLNRRLRTKNLLRDPRLWGVEAYWRIG